MMIESKKRCYTKDGYALPEEVEKVIREDGGTVRLPSGRMLKLHEVRLVGHPNQTFSRYLRISD